MITTHVLDTALGSPAKGVQVGLDYSSDGQAWARLNESRTNEDGRVPDLLKEAINAGFYRLRFETGAYFRNSGREGFYPFVEVVCEIQKPSSHYHVPLLLSPFGYSTYRGS